MKYFILLFLLSIFLIIGCKTEKSEFPDDSAYPEEDIMENETDDTDKSELIENDTLPEIEMHDKIDGVEPEDNEIIDEFEESEEIINNEPDAYFPDEDIDTEAIEKDYEEFYMLSDRQALNMGETGFAVAVDSKDNIWIAGTTDGYYVEPKVGDRLRILLMKLNDDLTLEKTIEIFRFEDKVIDGNGLDIKIDEHDNKYICGYIMQPNFIVANLYLGVNEKDGFLMKINPNDELEWIRPIGTETTDSTYRLAVNNNEVVVTGDTFGSFTSFLNPNYNKSTDVFLTQYNENGDKISLNQWGGEGGERITGMTFDTSGNIIVTGSTGSPIFDNIESATSGESADIFITKLSPNGDILWSKSYGDIYKDKAENVFVDSDDNIYIGGTFETKLYEHETLPGMFDIFLMKLDKDGEFIWVKSYGTDEHELIHRGAQDSEGFIYMNGFTRGLFDESIDIEPWFNYFVIKLDLDGEVVWIKEFPELPGDQFYSMALDNYNRILMIGNTPLYSEIHERNIDGIALIRFDNE